MKHLAILFPALVLGLSPLVAAADPHWGGHQGQGRGHGYTQAYWAGPCKIERKFRPDGSHKEERKCRGVQAYAAASPTAVVLPAPVMVAAPVMIEPGIVIQGTIRIR